MLSTGSLLSEPTFESSILEPRSSRAFDCHLQHDSAHHRKHLQDPSRRNACFYSLLPQPRNPRWNHRPRQDPSRTNTSFENIEPDVKWRLRNDRDSGPLGPLQGMISCIGAFRGKLSPLQWRIPVSIPVSGLSRRFPIVYCMKKKFHAVLLDHGCLWIGSIVPSPASQISF